MRRLRCAKQDILLEYPSRTFILRSLGYTLRVSQIYRCCNSRLAEEKKKSSHPSSMRVLFLNNTL